MFKPAELPYNDDARSEEVDSLGVFLTDQKDTYGDFVDLAGEIAECPIALLNLLNKDKQWSVCQTGLPEDFYNEVREAPRESSFCQYALLRSQPTIVPDLTKDERFCDHPIVIDDPKIRFWSGFPLISSTGNIIGTLCILDFQPRELDEKVIAAIVKVARRITSVLEMGKENIHSDLNKINGILDSLKSYFGNIDIDQVKRVINLSSPDDIENLNDMEKAELIKLGIIVKRENEELAFSQEFSSLKGNLQLSKKERKVIKFDTNLLDEQLAFIQSAAE